MLFNTAEAGDLDGASAVVNSMEPFDSFDLYRPHVRLHVGATTAIAELLKRGKMEQAAARLTELYKAFSNDPWTIMPAESALGEIAGRLAELAVDQPERVGRIIFGVLRGGRDAQQRDQVLEYIAAFSPVLKAVDVNLALEVWRRVVDVERW
jgi:hypothetical protein